MNDSTHADQIEAALAEHQFQVRNVRIGSRDVGCSCGWTQPEDSQNWARHCAHVAAVLAALTPEPVAGGSYRSSEPVPCEYNAGQHCYHPDEGCCICQHPKPAAARAVPVPAETDGLAGVRGQWFGLMDHILSAHRLAHANEYDYCGGCGKEYEYASEERHNEHIRDEMLAAMRDEPALLDVAAPAPEGER